MTSMSQGSLQNEDNKTLADSLTRHFSVEEILDLISRLAVQIQALHKSGKLHLRISPESVFMDSSQNLILKETDRSCVFGRVNSDQQVCPPELQNIESIVIPVNINSAADSLRHEGLQLNPTRIDVYQLGALFCLLMTGGTVHSYLRSPKTKAKVPEEFRSVLERVLGFEQQNVISDIRAFQNALQATQSGTVTSAEENSEPATESMVDVIPHSKESETSTSANKPFEGNGSDLPFQYIGHYQILERIGQGGMGDVYKGYESSLDRTVAIKVLPQEFARQEEFVKRFYAEATAAAKLIHPNIIQIYFIGEDQGYYYFAMQFVEGETLADLLKRKKSTDVEQTLAIVEQVLLGLSAAHEKGMIHRDIKPGNILLDRESRRALLADFGLVKSVFGGTEMTATGVVMGTVDYISPEQGRGLDVDARSDLYSLGILMYQMLSGHLPFHAESPTSMIFQHAYETPTPLNELSPSIPETLVKIVTKLMTKSPALRYQSAEMVLADIQAFRKGATLDFEIEDLEGSQEIPSVRQSTLDSRKVTPSPENSETVIIQAPLFKEEPLLPEGWDQLDVVGFWQSLKNRLFNHLQDRAPDFLQQLQNTQQQLDGAVYEYQRRQQQIQSICQEAEQVLTELKTEATSWHEAAIVAQSKMETAENEELSRAAIREKNRCEKMVEEVQVQITQQQEQLDSMSLQLTQVNAKLQQLISQRDLLNARLKSAQARAVLLGKSTRGKWSRQKVTHYALVITLSCIIISLVIYIVPRLANQIQKRYATKPIIEVKPEPIRKTKSSKELTADGYKESGIFFDSRIKAIEFRPHKTRIGYELATIHADDTVNYLLINDNANSYSGPNEIVDHLNSVNLMAYSQDGKMLAFSMSDGSIHLWRTKRPTNEIRKLEGHSETVQALLFSSDGKQLLSSSIDETIRLWDIGTGQEIKRIDERGKPFAWTRGETGFFTWGNGLKKWDFNGAPNSFSLLNNTGGKRFLSLPQLGDYGYSAEMKTRTPLIQWDRNTGQQIRTIGDDVKIAAISANGFQVMTSDSNGTISLWDPRNGEKRKQYKLTKKNMRVINVSYLSISTDGKIAACEIYDNVARKSEVRIWRLPLPADAGDLIHIDSTVNSLMFSPDGSEIVAGTQNQIRAWNFKEWNNDSFFNAKSPVFAIRSMSDGSSIIYGTGTKNSLANVIGIRDWKNFGRISLNPAQYDDVRFEGHKDRITSVDCSSSTRNIVSGSLDGTVRLWNILSREQAAVLELNRPVYAVRFKPQSDHEVYVCSNHKAIELWDLQTKKKLKEYSGMTFQVRCMDLSEDGTRLVAGGRDRTVRIWDTETAELLTTLEGHDGPVNSVAMLSEDRFNPLGGYVVSGSDDATVRYWDVQQQKELSCFRGHIEPVRCIAISPRNQFAVSGSDDGTIRRWKLLKSK